MHPHVEVLRDLCDAYGISGYESGVRKLFEERLKPLSEELLRDRTGGVVGRKTGDPNGPKVLIAGHLDEIGFMVTHITSEGFLKFQPIGGWWSQVVLAQRVIVQTRKDRCSVSRAPSRRTSCRRTSARRWWS